MCPHLFPPRSPYKPERQLEELSPPFTQVETMRQSEQGCAWATDLPTRTPCPPTRKNHLPRMKPCISIHEHQTEEQRAPRGKHYWDGVLNLHSVFDLYLAIQCGNQSQCSGRNRRKRNRMQVVLWELNPGFPNLSTTMSGRQCWGWCLVVLSCA